MINIINGGKIGDYNDKLVVIFKKGAIKLADIVIVEHQTGSHRRAAQQSRSLGKVFVATVVRILFGRFGRNGG